MNEANPSGGPPSESRPDSLDGLATLDLLARARTGDQPALDLICARYLPRLRRWARGRLPWHARGLLETEDLVQDSLLRTMGNLEGISAANEGSLQVYLRTVILNRIRDAARRPNLMSPLHSGSPDHQGKTPSPLEDLIGKDTLEAYDKALLKLSEGDQAAIIGRIEMGSSYAELALALAKPSPDAARMAVGRALAQLAGEMGRHE